MTEHPTSVTSRPFGKLPSGEPVDQWTLKSASGAEMQILTYGGIQRSLKIPNHNGQLIDVVLGHDRLEDYLSSPFYMGAVVGRIAGRVHKGKLRVEERHYTLPLNEPPNHLHGGPGGLSKRIWAAAPLKDVPEGDAALRLTCTSGDGDQGYPGELRCEVDIHLTRTNEFHFNSKVTASEVTPCSLTHHAYFNLNGAGAGNVFGHRMQVYSSEIIPFDKVGTLSDTLAAPRGVPAHHEEPVSLRDLVPQLPQHHGEVYWFGDGGTTKPVAAIESASSRLRLEVATTQSCLQTYFAAGMGEQRVVGKDNREYPAFAGFCMECEGYAHASNVDGFGDILVRPGTPQVHQTVYRFIHLP